MRTLICFLLTCGTVFASITPYNTQYTFETRSDAIALEIGSQTGVSSTTVESKWDELVEDVSTLTSLLSVAEADRARIGAMVKNGVNAPMPDPIPNAQQSQIDSHLAAMNFGTGSVYLLKSAADLAEDDAESSISTTYNCIQITDAMDENTPQNEQNIALANLDYWLSAMNTLKYALDEANDDAHEGIVAHNASINADITVVSAYISGLAAIRAQLFADGYTDPN